MVDRSIELDGVVGWRRTIRFALPTIISMVCISSYTLVDGAFVANLIGTDALASINILTPIASLVTGMGFMFSTGGSAYVANLIGKGEVERANKSFTTLVLFAVGLSLVLTLLGTLFMEQLIALLGAGPELMDGSIAYGNAYLLFLVFMMLQFIFMQMLIVTGRPKIALALSIASGMTNIVLDFVFIAIFDMGLTGAAIASGCGTFPPAVIGYILLSNKTSTVHFTSPSMDLSVIASTCSNGISEMVSEASSGVTALLYNLVMMRYLGPDGVSAITIIMYVQFFAIALILGYASGVAPVMSYNHGKQDHGRMRGLYNTSMMYVLFVSIAVFIVMFVFGDTFVAYYASSSDEVMELASYGAHIFSFAFLMMGINLYASSLFTSLSNGPVSALISAIRTMVLLAPMIVLLTFFFGIDAIWFAVPITELITLVISIALMLHLGRRYGFIRVRGTADDVSHQ